MLFLYRIRKSTISRSAEDVQKLASFLRINEIYNKAKNDQEELIHLAYGVSGDNNEWHFGGEDTYFAMSTRIEDDMGYGEVLDSEKLENDVKNYFAKWLSGKLPNTVQEFVTGNWIADGRDGEPGWDVIETWESAVQQTDAWQYPKSEADEVATPMEKPDPNQIKLPLESINPADGLEETIKNVIGKMMIQETGEPDPGLRS